MFILNGRTGETLKIGSTTQITILGIEGNQVSLEVKMSKETEIGKEKVTIRICNPPAKGLLEESIPLLHPNPT